MGKRIIVDTNVMIVGFVDKNSFEAKVLESLKNKEFTLVLSPELEEQILRVSRRLKGKDWTGYLRYLMWTDFDVEFVKDDVCKKLKKKYKTIPRKDLPIFVAGLVGRVECLVSNNREFIKKAAKEQDLFGCLSPEEFVSRYIK